MAKLLIWYATNDGQTRKNLERIECHVQGYKV